MPHSAAPRPEISRGSDRQFQREKLFPVAAEFLQRNDLGLPHFFRWCINFDGRLHFEHARLGLEEMFHSKKEGVISTTADSMALFARGSSAPLDHIPEPSPSAAKMQAIGAAITMQIIPSIATSRRHNAQHNRSALETPTALAETTRG